eukprot:gene31782-6979_t
MNTATQGLALDVSMENCVKLKGLPFKATPEDIQIFFTGLTVPLECILHKRHPDGRPNGEAFVTFSNSEDARRATQKDREIFSEKFGDRYVRVYPVLELDALDIQTAVQQSNSALQGNGGQYGHADSVVKMKSLPFEANQLDIIHFFEGFSLKPNGVQLVVRSDNKPTGEAFVDFNSVEEAARSVKERDLKVFSDKFGDRYVRLIQVSRKEMQATLALRFGGEGILKMKGIPFRATAADVRRFFATGSYRIKPDGISFIMHADGRPTGMAFIEFDTPQDAVRAMETDRAKFGPEYGSRFCMLQLVGRHEMAKVSLLKESESLGAAPEPARNMNKGQGQGMTALQAALQAAAMGNHMILNNPWIQQMAQMLNPALLNPNSDFMRLGMAEPEQGLLGLGYMGHLSQGLACMNLGNGAAPNVSSPMEQLQQQLMMEALITHQQQQQQAAQMEAFLANQHQQGSHNGFGLLQANSLPRKSSTQHSFPSSLDEDNSWMSAPANRISNPGSDLFMFQPQQQQQDWNRAAEVGRDISTLTWADQFVGSLGNSNMTNNHDSIPLAI